MSDKSLDHRTNSERQISKFQNTPNPVIYEIDDDDDDDDEVSEVDNHHHINSSTNNNNIVVQDDIIELDDDCDITITASNENTLGTTGYQTKESTIISKTIESITNICTNIDNSGQMKRILKKNLMGVYRECVSKNVNKHKIMSVLDTTSRAVQIKPEYRYSYLINCCNKLKKLQRKKVPLVTLSDKASKRPKHITKRHNLTNNTKKQKLDNNIIDLDNDTPEEDVIELKVVTERQTNGVHINLDSEDEAQVPSYSNKENISNGKDTIVDVPTVLNQTQRIVPNNDGNTVNIDLHKCYSTALIVAEESNAANSHIDKEFKIKQLENKLKILKETLDRIELFEVTTDDMSSPYIMAETIKTRIIKIYKQLCELTGTNYLKRHEVRLKVNMGHLEGPVRLLEQYINNNIDEQGNPPFPDLEEVSKCVSQANVMYNMGWSQKQIDDEARKLQKHFGQKIQKRRQKREWRDLLHICKEEVLDPADIDPELEAKLVANRRIAKKNEDEVFNKFVKMEERRFSRSNDYEIDMESDASNDSFIENNGNNQDTTFDIAQNIANSELTNMAPTVPKSADVTTSMLSNIIPFVSLPSSPSLGTPTAIIGHPVNYIQSQTVPITAISVNNSALSTAKIIAANNLNPNSNNGWTLFKNIDSNQCLRLQTVEVSFESNGAKTELVNKVSSEIDKVIETQENMNADDKQPEMVQDNISDTQPLLLEEPLETEIIKDDLNSLKIVIENPISLAKMNNDESVSRDNVQEGASSSDNVMDINTDNIKKEPPERTEVIIKLLEELGDDFTASISYIEDPFLVIEISDSSDSEDESKL